MGSRRRKKQDSSEFTGYDRSSGTRSRLDRVYTAIKIASSGKIYCIMVSFIGHYNAISIDRLPSKTKIEKIYGTLTILFYGSPNFTQLQIKCFFIKNTKNKYSSASDWWKNTNSCLKRMQGHFLKIPPLKKILQFQD